MTIVIARRCLIALAGAALAASLAGCPQQPTTSHAGSKTASLRLQWIPDAVFVGDYVAKQKGYWQQGGLDVKVEPGGFEFNSIKLVAAGTDRFGVSNLPQLLEARSNGVPVVAIGAVIPRSPIGWVSKRSSGIKKPQDFVGKKVGAQIGTHTEVTFEALMAKLGLDKNQVNRVPIKFDPQPFISGQIDVLPVYLIDQPYLLEAKGLQLNRIDPFDYGVGLYYGNVYITREDTLSKDPALVRGFLAGAYHGWQDTIDRPDEALDAFVAQNHDLDKEITRAKLKATLAMMTKESKTMADVARFDPTKVQATKEILTRDGGLKDLDATRAYTNDFLPSSGRP